MSSCITSVWLISSNITADVFGQNVLHHGIMILTLYCCKQRIAAYWFAKKCRTSIFQKSFFIRTTRIWNLLITRLDLDNVTFENFKSVLYGYYSRALAINYDPDSPRSFKSICLKCNTARFLDQEISCCMWFRLLLLYPFIFWVHSNWL